MMMDGRLEINAEEELLKVHNCYGSLLFTC